MYWPDIPMDGLVDAARPESLKARKFNKLAEEYIQSPSESTKAELLVSLNKWAANHEKLVDAFEYSEKIKVGERLSSEVSSVAQKAYDRLRQGYEESLSENEESQRNIDAQLTYLENGEEGIIVAIVPGLRALLSSSPSEESDN